MDSVSLFDAKNHLSALLDQVEDGKEVVITRRGKAIARLVPIATHAEKGRRAAEKLRALRQGISGRGEVFTMTELRAYRDEGRH